MHLAVGKEIGSGKSVDIELSELTRLMHMYLLGSSGSGKTGLLKTILLQDIAAGTGFGVLDTEDVLAPFVMEHTNAVLIDPTKGVTPMNPLAKQEGIHPSTVVENLISAFRRAWFDSWGPRLEDILRHSLMLLQEHTLPLTVMPRLFSDEHYREKLVNRTDIEAVADYFEGHFDQIAKRDRLNWIESVRNKVSAFCFNDFIRPCLETTECFDYKAAMDNRTQVAISVPDRVLKDAGRLFAMLNVSLIYQAALRRPDGATPPWYLIADEFQSIASRAFLELLTQTRKRGLGVIAAHQNLSQPPFNMDAGFLETVLANTATHVYFRLSRTDAERIAKEVFAASGTHVKKPKSQHWLWGESGAAAYYSLQEEREFYIRELETQARRECYISVHGEDGTRTYAAETYDLP